jgi:HSP20 family protein
MDRLFDDSFFRTPARLFHEETLPVDISEQEYQLLVKVSLPEFETEDIDVHVSEGVLSIKTKHFEEHEEQGALCYRRERSFGSVSRRIALPGIVHDAAIELKSGVLTLPIPLPEQAKSKEIAMKNGD